RRRPVGLDLFEQRQRLRFDAAMLLVCVRWKQPEARVLQLETAVALGDAAFAEDERLAAFGQRPANDGPLLERVLEHVASAQMNFSLRGWRSIRSRTAWAGSLPSYRTR